MLNRLATDAPHASRGPLTRWPRATDLVLALAVFALSVLFVTVSALPDDRDLTWDALVEQRWSGLALLAVAAAALLRRRVHPVGATVVVLAVLVVWAVGGHGDGQDLPLVVATYSVGRHGTDHVRGLVVLAAALGVSLIGTVVDPNQHVDVIPAVVLPTVPWYVGRRVRNRGDYLSLLEERAERLEAEQQARARRAVAKERSRIARELHDVVAHRVSMMTVQAGAAKTIARHDLDAAVDAMGDVERAGRQALGELRHLLGVLRPEPDDPQHLGPQPSLADVAALADELAATSADVTLTIEELPADLPAALELSAYRIVQESVTNVVKHAGPEPAVDIAVTVDDRWLTIDVTNTVGHASPGLPTSGYGIAGMRERATLLGGSLTAGPAPPDRHRVRARLPLESGSP